MSELHYALLKDNRVMNIIVVEKQDDKEIKAFCDEMGYDEFIYLADKEKMPMHSLRVGKNFVTADFDYLKSIGLSTRDNAEQAAWDIENPKAE
jgi:hypothetical protein